MRRITSAEASTNAGELEIDHGGAIAVDTEQLREVGARLCTVASRFAEAREAVGRAQALLSSSAQADPQVDLGALRRSGERVGMLGAEIENAGTGTLLMADAFEVVELRAQAEALALTDAAAANEAQARADEMVEADTRLGTMADWLVAGWKRQRFDGLGDQYDPDGPLPSVFVAGALVGVVSGLGKVRPGMVLSGVTDPMRVTPVKTTTPNAPTGLAAAFRRVPGATAQVAVEKYTMVGGAPRYVAYIAGTRNSLPWQAGESEPWDMKSNVELYQGGPSASYQATLDALTAAGVEPGDRVDVVAHSQGGMIAARLAMESEFEVSVMMTAGSPTEPSLTDDQTLLQLRHTDDVVSALAAGGSAEGTGSPDSFTASRVGDPHGGIQDLKLQTHGLETYVATAEMVDASDDPRAEAVDEYWEELGEAVEVERIEFHAERAG
ncbi:MULTISPECIES: hypothetical protein [Microbacterium]|uniref:hypothetical protein n=2 Tax=Microbacteriaceae TaxID=85023 RepID=UPI001C624FA5|nr:MULTISPECIES: hypothetical protein [Microbacterium]QYG12479.1 hypothetical protein KY497_04150 [Microbacterium sp. PAMC22086]